MSRVLTLAVVFLLFPLLSISVSAWHNNSFLSRVPFNLTHPTMDMNYTFQKLNLTIVYELGERWVRDSTNTSVPFNVTRNGMDWHEIVFKIDHTLPSGTKELYHLYRNSTSDSNDTNPYTDIVRLCLADVPDSDTLPSPCFTEAAGDADIFNLTVKSIGADARIQANIPNMTSGSFIFKDYEAVSSAATGSFYDGTDYWEIGIFPFDNKIRTRADAVYYRDTNGTIFNYNTGEQLTFSMSFDVSAGVSNLTMIRNDGSYYRNVSLPVLGVLPGLVFYCFGGETQILDEVVMVVDNYILMPIGYMVVTRGPEEIPPAVDTCTAPSSGDWEVDCSDNCLWSSAQDVPADIIMRGSGRLQLSDYFRFTGSGQEIAVNSGCTFEVISGGGW